MLDKVISQATYYTAAFCVLILDNLDKVAILVGILCTVATTVINWYYKCREDERYERNKK